MENLSKRLTSLSPSATIAMNQKGRDLKAKGVDVINLSVGEPDFFTPDHIKEAAKKAVDDNYSFYAPVPGYPELREAIADKFKRENNLEFKSDQIVVSTGAKHCLANALLSLVDPGDEVIVPAPYWVSYVEQVKIAEGKNVVLHAGIDQDFKITPEQLDRAVTKDTKVFMLCSPSNPTGAVYTREEMAGLAQVLEKHPHVYIITDEIYEHINFIGDHTSMAEFPALKDRTAVINGVSKAYAMTGYRIGYMAAPQWIARACTKLQGQMTSGATSVAQKTAEAALRGDQSCIGEMKKAFLRRRDLVLGLLNEMEGVRCNIPQGAFYVFPDMSAFYGKSVHGRHINGSMDLCMYLLEEGHIATVPGEGFGEQNCIRISYANSDENLKRAMERLEKALKALN